MTEVRVDLIGKNKIVYMADVLIMIRDGLDGDKLMNAVDEEVNRLFGGQNWQTWELKLLKGDRKTYE